jgi:hypothetical protein
MKKLPASCPKYIFRDYPEHAANWPEFCREVEGFKNLISADLSRADKWSTCSKWWKEFPNSGRHSESHGGHSSCFYYTPKRFPWAIFGRSASMLQRSVYISMEASDCDIRTVAEYCED